jgi:hypothetical protein
LGFESPGQTSCVALKIMKISPEPLCPLRAWRELWHAGSSQSGRSNREAALPANMGKSSKRQSFHWLASLLNRESSR